MNKETRDMRFEVLYKGTTSKGANYYKLAVEISDGYWDSAVYFGNTMPKKVTSLKPYGDNWLAEIQKHTSRDKDTGRFKCKRKV